MEKVCNLDKGNQGEKLGFNLGKGENSHPNSLSKILGSSKDQQKHGS